MSWSDGVKVYVTHIIDPLNFYARIGSGMLKSSCVLFFCIMLFLQCFNNNGHTV